MTKNGLSRLPVVTLNQIARDLGITLPVRVDDGSGSAMARRRRSNVELISAHLGEDKAAWKSLDRYWDLTKSKARRRAELVTPADDPVAVFVADLTAPAPAGGLTVAALLAAPAPALPAAPPAPVARRSRKAAAPKVREPKTPAAPRGSMILRISAAVVLRSLGAAGWTTEEAEALLTFHSVTSLNHRSVMNHLYRGRRAAGTSRGQALRAEDVIRWSLVDLPEAVSAELESWRAAQAASAATPAAAEVAA